MSDMTTDSANGLGPGPASGMHTAGLYSDMSVDGPEIGTLVVVFDRAKNLPNRKTMGKQDPYCSARLGKEAKKTETDRRGGQTPRWDQELRFTVHDSPDYLNLKITIFNDDKKTELIGETWINLEEVVLPGGGKNDTWHNLNFKGKYAGEIRVEMTYYDSRPKVERPDRRRESSRYHVEDGHSPVSAPEGRKTLVKRRPLPNASRSTTPPPVGTPDAARSFGPREYGSRSRGASMTPDHPQHRQSSHGRPPLPSPNSDNYPRPNDGFQEYSQSIPLQPDFLPHIPPKTRHRISMPQQIQTHANSYHGNPRSHMELTHSSSAPDVRPPMDDYYPEQGQLEVFHGHGQRGYEAAPDWEDSYGQDDHRGEVRELPPLPPFHSAGSSPVRKSLPNQEYTPHISNASPLQGIERRYGQDTSPRTSHPRSRSGDDYVASGNDTYYNSPQQLPYGPARQGRGISPGPNRHSHHSSPQGMGLVTSPPGVSPIHSRPSPQGQHFLKRHSVADLYSGATPPRQHPLAQEMRRSQSPQPPVFQSYADSPPIRPRAISPQPRTSLTAVRHPVQTFANQISPGFEERSPNSHPRQYPTPPRKIITAQPSPLNTQSPPGIPFSPDSFDAYNPSARSSPLAANPSPHSPFYIPPAPRSVTNITAHTRNSSQPPSRNADGQIVGWDGRVIDPSDHLPVDSWAPEPEQKTPTKTYGGSSDRSRGLAGPRSTPTSATQTQRMGSTVINVRTKGRGAEDGSPAGPKSPRGRNRLWKRNSAAASPVAVSGAPLREIDVPNPYSQAQYSERFSPEFEDGRWSGSFGGPGEEFSRGRGGGGGMPVSDYGRGEEWGSGAGYTPPKPHKIPLGDQDRGYGGGAALSQEMASIDLGARGQRAPARKSRFGF